MTHEDRLFAELARIGKPKDNVFPQKYYGNPAHHIKFDREQRGRMKDIDATESILQRWADWMRRPEKIAEGYPSKASGDFIASWRKDNDEQVEAADMYEIGKANAAVNSLGQYSQKIIYKRHNLGYTSIHFENEASVYESAKIKFGIKYFSR